MKRAGARTKRAIGWGWHALLVLVAIEVMARVCLALPYFADRRIFHDELSWRRSWVRWHAGDGVGNGIAVYDATTGWRPRPDLRDFRFPTGATANTNSNGFRGTQEYTLRPHPGARRIAMIGDSLTFGEGVNDAEAYPDRIQQVLTGVETVNMGVMGYGHDQMLIRLEEEGPRVAPDVVVLGFVRRDMSRNLLGFRDYAKPRFVMEEGKLRVVGSPVERPENVPRHDWLRPRAYDVGSAVLQAVRELAGIEEQDEEAVTSEILDEMRRAAERLHAPFVVAYLPVDEEITSHAAVIDGERFLRAYCDRRPEVRCFSTRPAFQEAAARGVAFRVKGHWDAVEHEIAAAAVARYLVAQGLVDREKRRP